MLGRLSLLSESEMPIGSAAVRSWNTSAPSTVLSASLMRTVRCALQSELYMKAGSMATAWPAAGEDAVAKVGFFFFGGMLVARPAGWSPLKVAQRQLKAYFIMAVQCTRGHLEI